MMWQQEMWSEWMWLAMGVAMIVVVCLATWAIIAILRMTARRPGGHVEPSEIERSDIADEPDDNERRRNSARSQDG